MEIVNCDELWCINELLVKKKLEALNFAKKKELIASSKPTPDLIITQSNKSHKRYFQRSIYSIRWIAGCSHLNKLFCWYCIFFSIDKSVWNSTGYDDLNNLTNATKRHQVTQKPLSAVISFYNFGKQRIGTALSRQLTDTISQHNSKIDHNRSVFQRLVDIVCFLGRQELPFRGHDETESSPNKGHFLECVHLLAKYDPVLEKHTQRSKSSDPTYLSNKIQNDIVHSVYDVINRQIEVELKKTPFVSVILDETADISNREQLCIIFRYFSENKIQDRFLGFIDVSESRNANAITNILIGLIEKYNFGDKLIAQSYDGASVMSGIKNGVQQKIKEKYPQAIYIWCNAHILNLVLSKSCSRISKVSSFFSALQSISTFFSTSTKRMSHYNKICNKKIPHTSTTRWSYTSRIVNVVYEEKQNLIHLVTDMIENDHNWDGDTIFSVQSFQNLLKSFEFNFFLEVFHVIFEKTDHLYNIIQKSQVDAGYCINKIKEFDNWLQNIFFDLFDYFFDKSLENNSPPLVKRHVYCAKTEFKRLFREIIDNISSEVNERYSEIFKLTFFQLLNNKNFDRYRTKFPCDEYKTLHQHFDKYFDKYVLKHQLISLYSSPELENFDVFQLIDFINENSLEDAFSELTKLAQLIVTIPATSSSAERSFSALKRIHTYLRNTQNQERLTELSMIAIEKQLLIQLKRSCTFYEDVIQSFLRKNRKFQLEYK